MSYGIIGCCCIKLYHVVRFKAWQSAKSFFGSEVDELMAFNNCMDRQSKIARSCFIRMQKRKKLFGPNNISSTSKKSKINLTGFNWINDGLFRSKFRFARQPKPVNFTPKNVYYQMSKKLIL